MLHEYRDIISKLRVENSRFASLFAKHSALDQKISKAGKDRMDYVALDSLKKEKLQLKDEIYAMCVAYQKAQA
ncbi:YdcH family protein [Wohlfahrtiimonas populi]|uniref:YdcH family protein n=1 Tax=Wohlfahrtiimonas populi TaxID=1940240 RepID=UPI00098D70BB|nr:YdcH family protein [Wohlfahrtiimonas populi]